MKTNTIIYLTIIFIVAVSFVASFGYISNWIMNIEAIFDTDDYIQRNLEFNKSVENWSISQEEEEGNPALDTNSSESEDDTLVLSTFIAEVSAYTSSVNETDDTPCITASGYDLCFNYYNWKGEIKSMASSIWVRPLATTTVFYGIIACPTKYDFGTKFWIDGNIYVCEDRMNQEKHPNDFDIYFGGPENRQDALNWGRQTLEIKIYK